MKESSKEVQVLNLEGKNSLLERHVKTHGTEWVDTSSVMPYVRAFVYALLPEERAICARKAHRVKGHTTQLIEIARYNPKGRSRKAAELILRTILNSAHNWEEAA